MPLQPISPVQCPAGLGALGNELDQAEKHLQNRQFDQAIGRFRRVATETARVFDVTGRSAYIHAKLGEACTQHHLSKNLPTRYTTESHPACCGLSSTRVTVVDSATMAANHHAAVTAAFAAAHEAGSVALAERERLAIPASVMSQLSLCVGLICQPHDEAIGMGYIQRAAELDPDNILARGIAELQTALDVETDVNVAMRAHVETETNVAVSAQASASVRRS